MRQIRNRAYAGARTKVALLAQHQHIPGVPGQMYMRSRAYAVDKGVTKITP